MLFITLSGWLLSLLGFLFGLWVYFRTRTLKKIVCSQELVGSVPFSRPEGRADFKFGEITVPLQISCVKIICKNIGNSTIRREEIREPLSVRVKGENIVVLLATRTSTETNNSIKRSIDGDSVKMDWDYFDAGEETSGYIYVSGSYKSVSFDGKFANGTSVIERKLNAMPFTQQLAAGIFIILVLFCGPIFSQIYTISHVVGVFRYDVKPNTVDNLSFLIITILSTFSTVLTCLIYIFGYRMMVYVANAVVRRAKKIMGNI